MQPLTDLRRVRAERALEAVAASNFTHPAQGPLFTDFASRLELPTPDKPFDGKALDELMHFVPDLMINPYVKTGAPEGDRTDVKRGLLALVLQERGLDPHGKTDPVVERAVDVCSGVDHTASRSTGHSPGIGA